MAASHIFKVMFVNQGKVYEIYARKVSHGSLFGFIEVEELVFGERSTVVVDPTEEKIKAEFNEVKRTYLPMHSVLRIDEVKKQGPAKIVALEGSNVSQFPVPCIRRAETRTPASERAVCAESAHARASNLLKFSMFSLLGAPALSQFRLEKLLRSLKSREPRGGRRIGAFHPFRRCLADARRIRARIARQTTDLRAAPRTPGGARAAAAGHPRAWARCRPGPARPPTSPVCAGWST